MKASRFGNKLIEELGGKEVAEKMFVVLVPSFTLLFDTNVDGIL